MFQRAGVAVIIRRSGNSYELLLIKRSTKIKDPWSGHIAFPGGHYEKEDSLIFNTVIRETKEEIGINLLKEKYLFSLSEAAPLNRPNLKVYPFVFEVFREAKIKLNEEVEEYYWISISGLKKEKVMVNYEGVTKETDAYTYKINNKKLVIWGLTKRIIDELLTKLFNYRE